MGRVEMALFKAILDRQEFELRRVPSYLGILEACGPDLYYAGLPIFIFLEQDEAESIDLRISHSV